MLTGRGGLDVLRDVSLPRAEPGPGQVRLAVRAVGAGATDVTMRRGRYAFAPPYPFVPGYEVLGEVEAIGAGVRDVQLGQRVAALVIYGGYAEELVVDADALVRVPPEIDAGEAIALVLNYVTAYQAMHRTAHVQAGQSALVTGASGGVGSALLQLLALAGVRVIAAASKSRHALVRALGATPIDSRSGAIDRDVRAILPQGVDVAFDVLGGDFVSQCTRATRRGGVVVGVGFSGVRKDGFASRFGTLRTLLAVFLGAAVRGRRGRFYGISYEYRRDREPFRRDLELLFGLLAAGKLRPLIAARLPLLAAREAGAMLERGGVEGKIVHLS